MECQLEYRHLAGPTIVYSDPKTSYRVGPVVSYANTAGAASFQVDLVMDSGTSSKRVVDHNEFGLSLDLRAANVAFAHRKKYVAATTPAMAASPTLFSIEATPTPICGSVTECPEGTLLADASGDGVPNTDENCCPAGTMVTDARKYGG